MFARPRVFNSETAAAEGEAAVSVVAVSQDGELTLAQPPPPPPPPPPPFSVFDESLMHCIQTVTGFKT